MPTIMDQVGTSFNTFSWSSMGYIALILIIVISLFVIFGFIFFFIWWKGFNIPVKIYEPKGRVLLKPEEIQKMLAEAKAGSSKTIEEENIKFDIIKSKRTHGRHFSIKGTPYFQIFMPHRKLEPVPIELMFNDGIHLLRLSREIFVPISKPNTIISIGKTVSISVTEHNKWITWNQMMSERINFKYQDVDAQKRAILYFVIGIAAMVIIGGFILWLIYSSAKQGLNAAERLGSIADSLVGGKKPV